jgi:flagellar M-ring protein FliF
VNRLQDLLIKIGPARLFGALGITAVVAAALFALIFRIGGEDKALLFSEIDMSEAGEIAAKLEQANIPYELRGDGTSIYVPRSKVLSTRLMLSGDGLPSQGSVGYEIFDTQDALGATQFQQDMNRLRALEGELARTIASLDGVKRARVHLVLPERRLFEQDKQDPSASIVVEMGVGGLSQGQVRAIRNLVASAVPGLKPGRVTIADGQGKLLAAAEEDEGIAAAEAVDERRAAIEDKLRKDVQDIVESIVGAGAARVQVSAEIDFSRVTQTSQTFDPDGKVVKESSSVEEKSSDANGRNAGAATAARNVPDGSSGSGGSGNQSASQRTEENLRYEISNTTKTEIQEGGRVKRLSVAVAVDGVTTPAAKGGTPGWKARDPHELERITALVKSAIGYDEARGDKVEVVNLKFAQGAAVGTAADKASLFSFEKNDIMRGAEILAALIAAMAVVFFVLRPLVGGMLRGPTTAAGGAMLPAGAGDAPLALPGGEEEEDMLGIARVQGTVKASTIKKVAEVVEGHPDESVQIIRNWLSERR